MSNRKLVPPDIRIPLDGVDAAGNVYCGKCHQRIKAPRLGRRRHIIARLLIWLGWA